MTRATRIALIAGSVVVAAAAFVVFKPDDEEPASNQTSTEVSAPADSQSAATEQAPTPTPKPAVTTIRVTNGEPVGGVTNIKVRKGDTVRFVVRSDMPEEVHLHGYDISRDVVPDKGARFRFQAKIEGIFEVELEQLGVPIASVEVRP